MMEGMPDSVSAAYSMTATTFFIGGVLRQVHGGAHAQGSTTASVVSTMRRC